MRPSFIRCLISRFVWLGPMVTLSCVYAQENIYIEREQGEHVLRWGSEEGSTSFLQYSTDLSEWQYTLLYDVGDGSVRRQAINPDIVLAEGGAHFYRLLVHPTNPDNPDDTDGDGLNNLFELKHGYVPVLTDSDDDGVTDGDEDLDEDGESNITEIANGTDANDSSSNSGGSGTLVSYQLKARSISYEESYLLYGLGAELTALGGNPHYFNLSSKSLVNYHREKLNSGKFFLGEEFAHGQTSTIYAEPSSYALGTVDIVAYWNANTEQEVIAEHVNEDYIYDMLEHYPFPTESQIADKDDWFNVDGVALPLASYGVGWYTGLRSRSQWQLRLFASSPVEEEVVVKKHYLKVSRKEVDLNGDPQIEVDPVTLSFTFRKGMSVSEPTAPEILKEDVSVYPWEVAAGATFYDEQISLVPVQFITDFNRDGMIDDGDVGQATDETPFVFWVNDDRDDLEIHEDADIPGEGADGEDNRVNGERDLVDFFPVQLRLGDILQALPSDKYSYVISHPTGALNFIEMPTVEPSSHRTGNGAGSYLANEDMAAWAMSNPLMSTEGAGSELTAQYLDAAKNGMGVLLFEVKEPTEQSFELVIFSKSDESEMARIPSERWMNTVPVEDMFYYVNLRGALETDYSQPDVEEIQHERFRKTRKGRWFVFCHGYNVNENDARGWNAEVFKRLHQMGSDAKFLGVTWEGNQGQISEAIPLAGGKTPDYWRNVDNAFKSSSALSELVNGLTGGEKVMAGHSLGNMLISSAICDHDLDATQYFMINAAVPREAYSAQHADADRDKVRNKDWENYATRLWPSDYWSLGFAANDARRNLTWRGRFSSLSTKTAPHNYFSSGEDVLKSGDGTSPGFFDIAYKGEGAWIKQEMGKGKATKAFASGISGGDWVSTGGWAFNPDAYLSYRPNPLDPPGTPARDDPNTLTNDQLRKIPFFKPFKTFDGQSVHGENGSAVAGDYANRSFLLGHDIPALSNPAGSNEVLLGGDMELQNTNMVAKLKTGFWGVWKHSDLKEQKMDHVWKLYENMVSKGKLMKYAIPLPTN